MKMQSDQKIKSSISLDTLSYNLNDSVHSEVHKSLPCIFYDKNFNIEMLRVRDLEKDVIIGNWTKLEKDPLQERVETIIKYSETKVNDDPISLGPFQWFLRFFGFVFTVLRKVLTINQNKLKSRQMKRV